MESWESVSLTPRESAEFADLAAEVELAAGFEVDEEHLLSFQDLPRVYSS